MQPQPGAVDLQEMTIDVDFSPLQKMTVNEASARLVTPTCHLPSAICRRQPLSRRTGLVRIPILAGCERARGTGRR